MSKGTWSGISMIARIGTACTDKKAGKFTRLPGARFGDRLGSFWVGYISIFRNEMEAAVVAYLDCIYELVSIIFTVFIRNTRLPGTSI